MARPTDRELLEAAQKGEVEAFGTLVRRHQKRIFRLAFHLVRSENEAEDVMQETFTRAYRSLDRFDGRSEPFTWLYRIGINIALNVIRSRKALPDAVPTDDPRIDTLIFKAHAPQEDDPAASAQQRQLAHVLCEGIDALSETLRTTLILVCIDGLPHEDASKILGCPEGTVAWRVHEARRKLREHLATRGFGGDAL